MGHQGVECMLVAAVPVGVMSVITRRELVHERETLRPFCSFWIALHHPEWSSLFSVLPANWRTETRITQGYNTVQSQGDSVGERPQGLGDGLSSPQPPCIRLSHCQQQTSIG